MLVTGFVLAALAGLLGWRARLLTPGGALGATLIGGTVFGFGGLVWAAALISFFVLSSLISLFSNAHKARALARAHKSGPRDLLQTLANGGLPALMALAVGATGHSSPWYPYFTLAYFGALAAATADTWATELGMLSAQQPRLITSGRPVPAGLSGGITGAGLTASVTGAAIMALAIFGFIQGASLLSTGQWFLQDWFLLLVLPFGGMAGSLADSFLGATLQRLYYCQHCQQFTEQSTHSCGQPTRIVHGYSWVNNDVVNFFATLAGALAVILASLSILIS
jgi:uncharacterized protein (TIGR00297 family)